MDNSLKTKEKPPEERGLTPPAKGKTKTFLIDKELKTKDLRQTAVRSGKRTDNKTQPKTRIKPSDSLQPRGESSRRRGSYAALRSLRVTAPLGCGSSEFWYGRKAPFRPVHTARNSRDRTAESRPARPLGSHFPACRIAP